MFNINVLEEIFIGIKNINKNCLFSFCSRMLWRWLLIETVKSVILHVFAYLYKCIRRNCEQQRNECDTKQSKAIQSKVNSNNLVVYLYVRDGGRPVSQVEMQLVKFELAPEEVSQVPLHQVPTGPLLYPAAPAPVPLPGHGSGLVVSWYGVLDAEQSSLLTGDLVAHMILTFYAHSLQNIALSRSHSIVQTRTEIFTNVKLLWLIYATDYGPLQSFFTKICITNFCENDILKYMFNLI